MAAEYHMHPTWWTGQENSDWDRVRAALKRYWQQVKWDLSLGAGRDLNQGLIDTVKQAMGIDPLPLPNQPVPRQRRVHTVPARRDGIEQRIGQRHAHSWS